MNAEFDDESIKRQVMQTTPGAIGADDICACLTKQLGTQVSWSAEASAGEDDAFYRRTFMDALHATLAMSFTDGRDEWAVLGQAAYVYMRTMPGFEPALPCPCGQGQLVYVGRCGGIRLYTESRSSPRRVKFYEFVAGVGKDAAKGRIDDCPFVPPAHLDPQEPLPPEPPQIVEAVEDDIYGLFDPPF